jgi:hypothetical protein
MLGSLPVEQSRKLTDDFDQILDIKQLIPGFR